MLYYKKIILNINKQYLDQYLNIFDIQGKVELPCLINVNEAVNIVAIEWYDGRNGYVQSGCPCLVICFDNGRCQIMKDESDEREFCKKKSK